MYKVSFNNNVFTYNHGCTKTINKNTMAKPQMLNFSSLSPSADLVKVYFTGKAAPAFLPQDIIVTDEKNNRRVSLKFLKEEIDSNKNSTMLTYVDPLYFRHNIEQISKKSKLNYTIMPDKISFTTDTKDFNTTPMVKDKIELDLAAKIIQYSFDTGRNGEIKWAVDDAFTLKEALKLGFKPIDSSLYLKMKDKDKIKSIFELEDIILANGNIDLYLPDDAKKDIINKIEEYTKNNLCNIPESEVGFKPAKIVSCMKDFSISRYSDHLSISSDNKELFDVNGEFKDHSTSVFPGDVVKTKKGVYLISCIDNNIKIKLLSDKHDTHDLIFSNSLQDKFFEQRSNRGDCFYLAAIRGILENPRAPEIFSNHIQYISRDKGSGNNVYRVIFPGFPDNPIDITDYELDEVKKSSVSTDNIKIVLLEEAYGRLRKELKWGDNPNAGTISEWLRGGFMDDALYTLTGCKTMWFDSRLSNTNKDFSTNCKSFAEVPESKEIINKQFETFASEKDRYIVTASTKYSDDLYLNKSKKIIRSHAYTILKIDPEKRELLITEPNDMIGNSIRIMYDEFLEYFNTIGAVELPLETKKAA